MKIFKISVELEGVSGIMFDRFFDHSNEDRPPERKLYLGQDNILVLPSENIYSFLFRDMAPVGVVRFVERNKAKEFIATGQAMLTIEPALIPFFDESGNPIKFKGMDDDRFYVNDWSAGLTKMSGGKIIKQEIKKRPVLRTPWGLKFIINLFENDKVTAEKLHSWFESGGLVVALGTYRPKHGRFLISKWEVA